MKQTAEYRAWENMKTRCYNPNYTCFDAYGGRGIRVCDRWHKFENFLADMGRKPGVGYSLDRINNDGNYEPGNCRWATMKTQQRNRSSNRLITVGGVTAPLAAYSESTGVQEGTIRWRLKAGYPPELAVTPGKMKELKARGA